MISFRYHIVTIVAVFLALGLGVLAGTTVIDQQIVDGLRAQIVQSNRQAADLKDEVDALAGERDRQDAYITDATGALMADRLVGNEVILVTQEGVDPAVLQQARSALSDAGADVVAAMSATSRLASTEPQTQDELAQIVGGSAGGPSSALAERTATQLGERLSHGPGATADGDVLAELLAKGFLVPSGRDGIGENDLPKIGGPGQTVVVLTGGEGPPVLPTETFVAPLTEALAAGGARVAVGESGRSNYDGVVTVRDISGLDGQIVTVDDLDERLGGLALVLGLHELQINGQGGDYGFKRGASTLYPEG